MRVLRMFLFLLFAVPAIAQQNVNGTVTLTANATDITPATGDLECGVGYVQFYLSGVAIGPLILPQGTDKYTFAWDSTTVPDNDYVLTAVAVDRAGTGIPPHTNCDGSAPNMGNSNSILIRVVNHPPTDTTPPVITISPPMVGVITNKQQPIQVAAMDQSPIRQIQLTINGAIRSTVANMNVLNYVWNTNPYKGTSVTIETRAEDSFGNAATTLSSVFVKK